MKKELTLTNLLNQTLAELTGNARIVGIFVALIVPISGLFGWVAVAGGEASTEFGLNLGSTTNLLALGAGLLALYLVSFVISIALTYWFSAALMERDPAPGFSRIWPWVGVYILLIFGIFFGFVLLVVPGVILLVRWTLVLPLVIEGKMPAMDAFSESWQRTSGYGWSIFGLLVIAIVVFLVLTGIVSGVTSLLGGAASIPSIALQAVLDSFSSAVFAAIAVAAWRLSSDETEAAAEVFG
uniref:glycerophosphoryl diester phosphodiesterase membrane domain-containing protein n=1 Tax=uncultured Erythrobacter sp. TaxID=263913 RepID=UPI002620A990|nr:glycerophosphoryl diester phosphodiesterase membrane domain-containing protein [uncultured Erythrobacter sp.]